MATKKAAIGGLILLVIIIGAAAYAANHFMVEPHMSGEHGSQEQAGVQTPALRGAAAAAASAAERAADYARNAEAHKLDAHESVQSSTLRGLTTPHNIQLATAYAEQAALYAGITSDLATITSRAAKAAKSAADADDIKAADVCAKAAEAVAKTTREQALLTARIREITHSYMTEYLDGVDELINEAEGHGNKARDHFSSGEARLRECLGVGADDPVQDITF